MANTMPVFVVILSLRTRKGVAELRGFSLLECKKKKNQCIGLPHGPES